MLDDHLTCIPIFPEFLLVSYRCSSLIYYISCYILFPPFLLQIKFIYLFSHFSYLTKTKSFVTVRFCRFLIKKCAACENVSSDLRLGGGLAGFLHQLQLASHDLAAIWQKNGNKRNSKSKCEILCFACFACTSYEMFITHDIRLFVFPCRSFAPWDHGMSCSSSCASSLGLSTWSTWSWPSWPCPTTNSKPWWPQSRKRRKRKRGRTRNAGNW